jgi:hypothetical protein
MFATDLEEPSFPDVRPRMPTERSRRLVSCHENVPDLGTCQLDIAARRLPAFPPNHHPGVNLSYLKQIERISQVIRFEARDPGEPGKHRPVLD